MFAHGRHVHLLPDSYLLQLNGTGVSPQGEATQVSDFIKWKAKSYYLGRLCQFGQHGAGNRVSDVALPNLFVDCEMYGKEGNFVRRNAMATFQPADRWQILPRLPLAQNQLQKSGGYRTSGTVPYIFPLPVILMR